MSRPILRRLRVVLLAGVLLTSAWAPTPVLAQSDEVDITEVDGRVRGYEGESAVLEPSSTALTYMLMAALTVLAIGVMFKSARRTHLD